MMQKVGDDAYRMHKEGDPKEWRTPMHGLSLRQYYAGQALMGLMGSVFTSEESITVFSNKTEADPFESLKDAIARVSIEAADALLAELAKPEQP